MHHSSFSLCVICCATDMLATHITTGVNYAIKREPIHVAHPQLEHEAEMYRKLAGGGKGVFPSLSLSSMLPK